MVAIIGGEGRESSLKRAPQPPSIYMMAGLQGFFFFFQAEDGIRDYKVTGVQTCALPILIEIRSDREGLELNFRIASIIPMSGLGADPTLTPTYKGLTDAGSISNWDAPRG